MLEWINNYIEQQIKILKNLECRQVERLIKIFKKAEENGIFLSAVTEGVRVIHHILQLILVRVLQML